MVAPCVTQARLPSTMPKQWYSGTGMHNRSSGVRRMHSPMKKPLFRILRCVSVAPLGKPVVPLVNWMLIASVFLRPAAIGSIRASLGLPRASSSVNRSMPGCSSPSPATSIHTTERRVGTRAEVNSPAFAVADSGASSRSMPR